ncbi:helix-turn-helix domain-containing protein [Segniliparus rotundus]|uniref:helix-turn-helix transcriptional regulator n=1 Tax=Segniliparus rotundus TaxID=286802 RepID=UPI0009FDA49D
MTRAHDYYESGAIPEINLPQRLRLAREYAGLNQGELAEHIGVSIRSVNNSEAGKSVPRPVLLKAWALATGVRLSWIETGSTPASPDGPDSPNNGADVYTDPASTRSSMDRASDYGSEG